MYLNAAHFDFIAKQKRDIKEIQRTWPKLNPKHKHIEKKNKETKYEVCMETKNLECEIKARGISTTQISEERVSQV